MSNNLQLQKLLLLPAVTLVGMAALVGCRNAAYSELYVENMAAEIRDLEDQLYEYDNEYHVLEQQLQSLKAENQELRQGSTLKATPSRNGNPPPGNMGSSSLEFAPRDSLPGPLSIPKQPETLDSRSQSKAESILDPSTLPANELPQKLPENTLPAVPRKQSLEDIDPDMLEIPSITPGTPKPPALPTSRDFSHSQSQPSHDLELNLSRIEIPAQLTSGRESAQLTLASEKPADMRVVEIAFHPTLTRAANFDDEPDDDGLYLVLQPKNVEGQLVPTPGSLEIAILDPSRDERAARIGRWTYTAAEVKAKFQPLGSNQGIHLTLPWNGPDPGADRVIVFIRYTFPDGRQVVNDKSIFVSGKGSLKTVWVPRSLEDPAVVSASFSEEDRSPIPNNVVRPQGSTNEPAPHPGE